MADLGTITNLLLEIPSSFIEINRKDYIYYKVLK